MAIPRENGKISHLSLKFKKNKSTLKLEFYKYGEVAEWSIAPVLKTGMAQVIQGSNPCFSAIFVFKAKTKII